MKISLAFVTSVLASLTAIHATPTFYLVGDSTMASHTASEGIQGWGVEIPNYLQNINIVNRAVSGRSARSYTMEGRWAQLLALLKAGDYVVIEFGHNDGGDPATYDTASVYGDDPSVTQTVTRTNGTVEVVYTWGVYVGRMVHDALAIGATPIVSSQTPNNPYENSATIVDSPSRFVQYAKEVAGNYSVPYVDHFESTIQYYAKLGKATVDAYFPNDHTHTNTAGAISVAWSFVQGLKCSPAKGVLAGYLNSVGQTASCGGGGPSSATSSSTSKTSSTSSASSGTQTHYGQCGGIGWTGPTTCVSGTTCTYSNDWYSQCL